MASSSNENFQNIVISKKKYQYIVESCKIEEQK